jgi:ankyrin repeat protein
MALQSGRTPLYYACLVGNVIAAEELCDAGADVNYVAPRNGVSVLHTACGNYGSGWRLIELLHAKGVNLNVQDAYGHTPLHYCKTAKVAKTICGCGVDYTVVDATGLTAQMHHAVRPSDLTTLLQSTLPPRFLAGCAALLPCKSPLAGMFSLAAQPGER